MSNTKSPDLKEDLNLALSTLRGGVENKLTDITLAPAKAGDLLTSQEFSTTHLPDRLEAHAKLRNQAQSLAHSIESSSDIATIEVLRPLTENFHLADLFNHRPSQQVKESILSALRIIALHQTVKVAGLHQTEVEWLPPAGLDIIQIEKRHHNVTAEVEAWAQSIPALNESLELVITGKTNNDGNDWRGEVEMKTKLAEMPVVDDPLQPIISKMNSLVNGIALSRVWQKEGLGSNEQNNGNYDTNFNLNMSRLIRLFAWTSYLNKRVDLDTDTGVASWEKTVTRIKQQYLPLIKDKKLQTALSRELDLMANDILGEEEKPPQPEMIRLIAAQKDLMQTPEFLENDLPPTSTGNLQLP